MSLETGGGHYIGPGGLEGYWPGKVGVRCPERLVGDLVRTRGPGGIQTHAGTGRGDGVETKLEQKYL